MRLALGGVQFGMHYGIANVNKEMSMHDVRDVLINAKNNKIDMVDTAIGYGNSEQYIGDAGVSGFKIITKLPAIPKEITDCKDWIKKQIDKSMTRLNVRSLYGVLLHEPSQLTSLHGEIIWNQLQELKEDGVVNKLGFSLYDINELNDLMPCYLPEIIQVPCNILDQRLLSSCWVGRLKDMGTEIHVRSIFLQGLLLMNDSNRPEKFYRWRKIWQEWSDFLNRNNISAYEACLNFVLSKVDIDKVVIGVDSVKQLDDLLAIQESKFIDFSGIPIVNDLDLIDPSRWDELK